MRKINGICMDGKFYEAVADADCCDCAFNEDEQTCRKACDFCGSFEWDCAFQFSQELTDKINER